MVYCYILSSLLCQLHLKMLSSTIEAVYVASWEIGSAELGKASGFSAYFQFANSGIDAGILVSHIRVGIFVCYCRCCLTNHCQQKKSLCPIADDTSNADDFFAPNPAYSDPVRRRQPILASPRQISIPDVTGKSDFTTRFGSVQVFVLAFSALI